MKVQEDGGLPVSPGMIVWIVYPHVSYFSFGKVLYVVFIVL